MVGAGGIGALAMGGLALNRALEEKRAKEYEPSPKKTKNDSLYYRTSMYNIADLIEDATDVRVDHVFSGDVGYDGLLSATFLSDGKFYYMEEYEPGKLYFERNDTATAELNEYAHGYFEAQGLRCDSIAPYYSLMEELRLDVNCSAGNKPCGSICIPQRYTCNVGKGTTGKAKRSLRSPRGGGFGRQAALAGAGLAAVGLGGAALANRDKIGSSVKKTMKRMQNPEGYNEAVQKRAERMRTGKKERAAQKEAKRLERKTKQAQRLADDPERMAKVGERMIGMSAARTKRQVGEEMEKTMKRVQRAPKTAERSAKVVMGRAQKGAEKLGRQVAGAPKRAERMAKVAMGNMSPERQAKFKEREERRRNREQGEIDAVRARKERIAKGE